MNFVRQCGSEGSGGTRRRSRLQAQTAGMSASILVCQAVGYSWTATAKSVPSHLFCWLQNTVKRTSLPEARDWVGRSQINVSKPVG